jgi:hypothetical protein
MKTEKCKEQMDRKEMEEAHRGHLGEVWLWLVTQPQKACCRETGPWIHLQRDRSLAPSEVFSFLEIELPTEFHERVIEISTFLFGACFYLHGSTALKFCIFKASDSLVLCLLHFMLEKFRAIGLFFKFLKSKFLCSSNFVSIIELHVNLKSFMK